METREPTTNGLKHLDRLRRLRSIIRYSFLATGVVLAALHVVWHILLSQEFGLLDITETAIIGLVGPAVVWLLTGYAGRLVAELGRRYAELQAVNQITQQVLKERTQLQEDMEITNKHLRLLQAVNEAVSQKLSPQEVCNTVLDNIILVLGLDAGEVWMLDITHQELRLFSQQGIAPAAFKEKADFAIGVGFPGLAVQTKSPLFTTDLAHETRFLRKAIIDAGFTCFGAIPILLGDQAIGAITAGAGATGGARLGM